MLTSLARAPQALDHAAFRAMFAARKQVFIDLLKWDLPILAGEFEVDQFDTPDAEYLILLDEQGRHRASARLLPTDQPHLLGDLYPFLCNGPVPSGPSVREITRFCLDRHQTASERRMARDQLVTALAEHARRCGITDYTGVAELSWFSQILRFGWSCSPLGQPVRIGGCTLAALHIRIDDQTLDGLRTTGVYRPLTFRLTGNREAQA
jgi:acyl homoserine lactone synthase/acyl-homoserine lactone synthase